MRLQLTPRERTALVALAGVLVLMGFYLGVHEPIQRYREQVHAGVLAAQTAVAKGSAAKQQLARLQGQVSELRARYAAATGLIPPTPDEPRFLAEVAAVADRSGVTLQGIQLGKSVAKDGRVSRSGSLVVSGSLGQEVAFIRGIESLPILVAVQSVKLDVANGRNSATVNFQIFSQAAATH